MTDSNSNAEILGTGSQYGHCEKYKNLLSLEKNREITLYNSSLVKKKVISRIFLPKHIESKILNLHTVLVIISNGWSSWKSLCGRSLTPTAPST